MEAVVADPALGVSSLEFHCSRLQWMVTLNTEWGSGRRSARFAAHQPARRPRRAAYIAPGEVVQFRHRGGTQRFHVSTQIVQGNSGGPVLDEDNRGLGVAVTGTTADSPDPAEAHGVVPIAALSQLRRRES